MTLPHFSPLETLISSLITSISHVQLIGSIQLLLLSQPTDVGINLAQDQFEWKKMVEHPLAQK